MVSSNSIPIKRRDTKQEASPFTEQQQQARTGIEIIIYCAFLGLFLGVTVVPKNDPNIQSFTSIIRKTFYDTPLTYKDGDTFTTGPALKDVITVADWYEWLKGPLLHNALVDDWFVGEPFNSGSAGRVTGVSQLMGSVVIRQKRVQSYTCDIPLEFRGKQIVGNCMAAYSEAYEAKEDLPYIEVAEALNVSAPWVTAFKHHSTLGYSFSGANSAYSSGGYGLLVGGGVSNAETAGDISAAKRVVDELHNNRWIDVNTRAAAITLTVFNPNINMFIFVDLVTEFPPSGGLVPSATLRPVRLYQYYTTDDFMRLSFEIICVLFLGYYAAVEVLQAKDGVKEYIKDMWNVADVINILLFLAQVVFRVVTQVLFLQMQYDPSRSDDYDLASISALIIRTDEITAINAFLLWFRFFRYFSESERLNQLVKTIGYALIPTIGFLFIIALFLTAFSHAGFMLFGAFVPELRTFSETILALFRGMFGGLDYEVFLAANPIMGPFFFILFQTWMSIFMVQLVIAILIDSYREATREEYVEGLDFPPFASLGKELYSFFKKVKSKRKKKVAADDAEDFGGYGGKWAKQAEEDDKKAAEEKQKEAEKKKKKRRRGSGEGTLLEGSIASQEELQKLQSNLEQRLTNVESRLEKRIGDIEKIFVTTVAPIVETLDLMLKKSGEAIEVSVDTPNMPTAGSASGTGGGTVDKKYASPDLQANLMT